MDNAAGRTQRAQGHQTRSTLQPVCGAKRFNLSTTRLGAHDKQPYPQLMLKTNQGENRPVSEGLRRQMEKAATLVMLQPRTPARESTARMHVPSQPLMRSPLSQFQTPTAPRRVSRFFRVWMPFRSPCRANHSAYFGLTSFISPNPFSCRCKQN